MANERQIILELKAKMSDVGEVRASNMELIDQLTKAKTAIEKLTEIKERQRVQIDVCTCTCLTYFLNLFTGAQNRAETLLACCYRRS